jgi:dihydrofolate synthase/folylpolyglutamate synthase
VHKDRARTWVVDAAISEAGIRASLEWSIGRFGEPAAVLLCLPDVKDVEGGLRVLGGRNIIAVRAGTSYLEYRSDRWPVPLRSTDEAFAAVKELSGHILALGTISFIGDVLDHLDVPCDVAYETCSGSLS